MLSSSTISKKPKSEGNGIRPKRCHTSYLCMLYSAGGETLFPLLHVGFIMDRNNNKKKEQDVTAKKQETAGTTDRNKLPTSSIGVKFKDGEARHAAPLPKLGQFIGRDDAIRQGRSWLKMVPTLPKTGINT